VDNSADNVFVHSSQRGEWWERVKAVRGLAQPWRRPMGRAWIVGDRLSTAKARRIWLTSADFPAYPHIPIPYHEHDRFSLPSHHHSRESDLREDVSAKPRSKPSSPPFRTVTHYPAMPRCSPVIPRRSLGMTMGKCRTTVLIAWQLDQTSLRTPSRASRTR